MPLLSALALATTIAAAPQEPRPDCAAFASDRVMIIANPEVARQGQTLSLRAYSPRLNEASVTIPLVCLSDWRIAPEGAAALTDDGGLAIAPDAPAGQTLTVGATAPSGFASWETRIVGANEIVLTGFWRQVDVTCPQGGTPSEPVRELEFTALGGFSVTFQPFETYRDYWGKITFDAGGGMLSLEVEDGNYRPSGAILSGRATLEGSRLTLDGFNLGDRAATRPVTPCRYVFEKV